MTSDSGTPEDDRESASTDVQQTRVGHTKVDETDVYVGRGPGARGMQETPVGERGWLGNPFPVDEITDEDIAASSLELEGLSIEEKRRLVSIELFREEFEETLASDEEFRSAVEGLSGSVLGCWCQTLSDDEPACHAEVIAEWADRLAADEQPPSIE